MAIVPHLELTFPLDAIVPSAFEQGVRVVLREARVRALVKSIGSVAEVLRSDVPLRA